ncbi:MAG: hypothetical protein HYW26_00775 [Candidatus Aenigmarchaeota archaeon]|nr:hypothetical protein [Candidatus Aenigmarchaeota archaeon]
MVLDIIAAAVLISFGVFAIIFSVDSGADDPKLLFILFIGAVFIFAGGWIIISKITWEFIIRKIAGLLLGALGIFLVVGFPDVAPDYQRAAMSKTGVFFGLIFLIIGIYLLLF